MPEMKSAMQMPTQLGWAAESGSPAASYSPMMTAPMKSCEWRQALVLYVSPHASQLERVWATSETHIALGQQVWAKFHVVFQIKRSSGLEAHAESREVGRVVELLHTSKGPKLFLLVLGDR